MCLKRGKAARRHHQSPGRQGGSLTRGRVFQDLPAFAYQLPNPKTQSIRLWLQMLEAAIATGARRIASSRVIQTGVVMDNNAELERIKAALEALLNQMVEIDCARREPIKPGELRFKIIDRGEPIPAGRERQNRELLERPVRTACKHAITLLGKRVHELLGDYDAMVAFAEEVAAGGPLSGHRQSILYWAWHGIGGRHVELPRGASRAQDPIEAPAGP
jgi:hypothetical protein